MWSRGTLKKQAKAALSKTYWIAFAVCLLSGILTGGTGFTYRFGDFRNGEFHGFGSIFERPFVNPAVLISFFAVIFLALLFGILFGAAYGFFVAAPVNVGKFGYFLENRKGAGELSLLFGAFKKGKYLDIVKSMAWRFLFTFLWTLLFIIPGIVKAYSYSMVPYILCDNPNIGYGRALKLSMEMTRGYKFKIFVLQLSFLGWYLLGVLCLFVGVLFVTPYFEATLAEAYVTIRGNAFEQGICRPDELNYGGGSPENGRSYTE